MPPSLAEVQDAFAAALLDPGRAVPAAVTGPDGAVDAKRFGVYRNNVVHGLVTALEARFPVTVRLVGTEFFRAMAHVFVAEHPPTSPILITYGDEFPRFVEGFAPARSVPYLADIARLERAWSQAYNAPEATPVAHDALACRESARLERARLTLHPSLRLLRSEYPVATIWSAHQVAGEVSPPAAWQGEDAVILRPRAEVRVHLLPPAAFDFIAALATGVMVHDAADTARRRCADFDAGYHVQGLVDIGAVVSIDDSRQEAAQRKVIL